MSKFLCTLILVLLFISVTGSNINDTANYLLEDIEKPNIFATEEMDINTKENMELTTDGSQTEVENKTNVKKRDKISTGYRDRFFEYVQELNKLSFLQLTSKLNELHMEYMLSFQYFQANWRIYPKNYLQFFNEEQLTCLISEMNPDVTNVSTLSQDKQAEYLHHWADWLWIFYMDEGPDRVWFFLQMRSLEYSSDILNDYESGDSSAEFVIYLAHSFIRSINIYRKCAYKIPLTSLLSDEYVSQYLFRGIRVAEFNITTSMFPANFQSYAMNTEGVHSVLYFYWKQHHDNRQDTVVITMMEYSTDIQQLAQPIAIFDLMSARYNTRNKVQHHMATEKEKEVIFPPFCDFSLNEFKINDIKNEFHREFIVAHMWRLAFANPYNYFNANIKLLWVTDVNCLQLYEPLRVPFVQSEHNELENEEFTFSIPPKASIHRNIEFWQVNFPQEVHPCIRLFTTHEDDITNREILEEQEIETMILDFMEHESHLYKKIEKKMNEYEERISNEEYIEAFQTFKERLIEQDDKENENNYATNTNELLSSIHYFYRNIKMYLKIQSIKTGLSRYLIKLYLVSYTLVCRLHIETAYERSEDFDIIQKKFPEISKERIQIIINDIKKEREYEWNESLAYCLEWQNKHMMSNKNTDEQKTLEINECYSDALSDSDLRRFVCEYEDYTYSLSTDFPCKRINKKKNLKEFGRFCKLSKPVMKSMLNINQKEFL